MRKSLLLGSAIVAAFALLTTAAPEAPSTRPAVPPVLDFKMKRLGGEEQSLSQYAGKVVLIVNTASKCGYTKQYAGLEALHAKYADKGLAVVGFPCNQFKNQEPGSDQDIADFCKLTYGVKFDMFSKVDVNGDAAAPLYQYLKSHAPETGDVKWNFEKFLIAKDGTIVARYRSKVTPEEIEKAIEEQLAK